jgi:hypothetical protein
MRHMFPSKTFYLAAVALALTAATPAPAATACLIVGQATGPLHGVIRIVSPCDATLKTTSCAKPLAVRPVFDLTTPLCILQSPPPPSKAVYKKMVSTIELNRSVRYSMIAQSGHAATITGTLKSGNDFWLNPYGIDVENVTADP